MTAGSTTNHDVDRSEAPSCDDSHTNAQTQDEPAKASSSQQAGFSFDESQFDEQIAVADGTINWTRISDHLERTVCDVTLIANGSDPGQALCPRCKTPKTPSRQGPSVRRTCTECGEHQFHSGNDGAEGPFVRKGETILFPRKALTSRMRFVGGASFSRVGIDWFARQLFGFAVERDTASILGFLGVWKVLAEESLRNDPATPLLESENPDDFERWKELVAQRPDSNAQASLSLIASTDALRERLAAATEEARALVSDMFQACSAQSLLAFQFAAAEACFQANAFDRMRWLLWHCRKNIDNASESFWQQTILENPFVVTQLFASPILIHGERFYVGGIRSGGKHGKIADFLLKNKLTSSAIILEIKTPTAQLLRETEYRQDVFAPSLDLTGAVQQILEQRAQFVRHIDALQSELEPGESRVETGIPECIVLIGNASRSLTTRSMRRCFEAYRSELRTVRVVAFDELLARIESLLALSGVTDDTEPSPPNSQLNLTGATPAS